MNKKIDIDKENSNNYDVYLKRSNYLHSPYTVSTNAVYCINLPEKRRYIIPFQNSLGDDDVEIHWFFFGESFIVCLLNSSNKCAIFFILSFAKRI